MVSPLIQCLFAYTSACTIFDTYHLFSLALALCHCQVGEKWSITEVGAQKSSGRVFLKYMNIASCKFNV